MLKVPFPKAQGGGDSQRTNPNSCRDSPPMAPRGCPVKADGNAFNSSTPLEAWASRAGLSGEQELGLPARARPDVDGAVVEAALAPLPELEAGGDDPEASPVGWPWNALPL